MKLRNKLILVATITGLSAGANAAVLVTTIGQNTAYTVSTSDLLQTAVASSVDSLTLNVGENNAAGAKTSAVLNNGVFGVGTPVVIDNVTGKAESVVINFGTMTYNLDTSINTFGYDITSIATYAGWADFNRGSQAYTVSYSIVGNAGFSTLTTVTLITDSFTQQKIEITENATNILATGVDAIRFDFGATTGSQQFSGVGYKELDVLGVATIPEPSSMVLLGLAGLGLISRRRRTA